MQVCMQQYVVCNYAMNSLHATLCSMQVYNECPACYTMQYAIMQWMLCMLHYAVCKYLMNACMLHYAVFKYTMNALHATLCSI